MLFRACGWCLQPCRDCPWAPGTASPAHSKGQTCLGHGDLASAPFAEYPKPDRLVWGGKARTLSGSGHLRCVAYIAERPPHPKPQAGDALAAFCLKSHLCQASSSSHPASSRPQPLPATLPYSCTALTQASWLQGLLGSRAETAVLWLCPLPSGSLPCSGQMTVHTHRLHHQLPGDCLSWSTLPTPLPCLCTCPSTHSSDEPSTQQVFPGSPLMLC